jgi:uncharacterized beta-barrel protein YwiB (DUF1934 family)
MTRKDLRIDLVDLGINRDTYLNEEAIEQFDQEEIYEKDGHSYLIYDTELSSDEINTALLAKQTKEINMIRNRISFFIGVTILSILLSIISLFFSILK